VAVIVPVLLYHSVRDAPIPGEERWTVSPRLFDAHVDVIAQRQWSSLTVTGLADALKKNELPVAPLAITFDDGYADTLSAARKLAEAGLKSTVFVTTGTIGHRDMMDRRALAALAGLRPIEIGAHSVTHPRLDELGRSRIATEVGQSKDALESMLGKEITSFAYPHGAYDRRVRAEVIARGFNSAAAVKNALSHDQDDPFAIARWTVRSDTTVEQLEDILNGAHAPLAWAHTRVRTRAYRTWGRLRRAMTRDR
jgi:peptidoglycan/xylan/chitin deacetylase (PgdA/CDA1 family)